MRQVNLVNDQDEIIGQAELLDAHRGEGKKHQAVSLFLFHKKNNGELELLIQQRSEKKIVGSNQWANTLCANLLPEEGHIACLKRRIFEELGFNWQENWATKEVAILDYQVICEDGFAENEIDHFFVLVLDDQEFANLKIEPNPEEVSSLAWLDWELIKNKKVGNRAITPWLNLFLDNQEVINKIEKACQKQNH